MCVCVRACVRIFAVKQNCKLNEATTNFHFTRFNSIRFRHLHLFTSVIILSLSFPTFRSALLQYQQFAMKKRCIVYWFELQVLWIFYTFRCRINRWIFGRYNPMLEMPIVSKKGMIKTQKPGICNSIWANTEQHRHTRILRVVYWYHSMTVAGGKHHTEQTDPQLFVDFFWNLLQHQNLLSKSFFFFVSPLCIGCARSWKYIAEIGSHVMVCVCACVYESVSIVNLFGKFKKFIMCISWSLVSAIFDLFYIYILRTVFRL